MSRQRACLHVVYIAQVGLPRVTSREVELGGGFAEAQWIEEARRVDAIYVV
jgi:hypothetical protein